MRDKQAENLAKRLEEPYTHRADVREPEPESIEIEKLVKTANFVRQVPHPVVSDSFRRNARVRILNQISAGSAASNSPNPVNLRTELVFSLRRVLVGMAILVGLMFAGGLFSFSAQNALPGDALFPVKLQLEQVQLLFASDAESAILQTQFASNRLTEIQLLVVHGRYDDIDPAVAAFEDNVDHTIAALAQVALADGASTYPILMQIEKDMGQYAKTLDDLLAFVPADTQMVLARAITATESLGPRTD